MKIVLQKFITDSGLCSRRYAEDLIRGGKVLLNGRVSELGDRADENDEVIVNGKKILIENKKIYIALNKPAGYTCTSRSFRGEKNVFDLMPEKILRNFSLHIVGRLDKESRGLVLLTNDGDLTQRLTHPKYEHQKEYIVKIKNFTNQTITGVAKIENILNIFKKGLDIGEDDGIAKVKYIEYLNNDKFKIILTEGKKRQIRRMFRIVECEVLDLERIRIGKLKIGDLKEGLWREIKKKDIL